MSKTSGFFVFYITPNTKFQRYSESTKSRVYGQIRQQQMHFKTLNDEQLSYLIVPVAIGVFKPIGIAINPMLASMAMVVSSLTVILNALRIRNVKFDSV